MQHQARQIVLFLLGGLALLGQGRLTPVDEAGYRKLVEAGRGQVTLVDFWATWCVPCREEMPQLAALARKHKNLRFVTVSCDEPEQESGAIEFLSKSGISKGYLKRAQDDEAFINAIDRQWSGALPALFLYDRQGRKVRSFIGETDMGTLEAALNKLL